MCNVFFSMKKIFEPEYSRDWELKDFKEFSYFFNNAVKLYPIKQLILIYFATQLYLKPQDLALSFWFL